MSLPVVRVKQRAITTVGDFAALLADLLGLEGELSKTVTDCVGSVFEQLGPVVVDEMRILADFYGRLNQKLGVNRAAIAVLYEECAANRVTFNYNAKRRLERAINACAVGALRRYLRDAGVSDEVIEKVLRRHPLASPEGTRNALANEVKNRTKLRKSVGREVLNDVYNAAAGPLVWSLWEPEALANVFRTTKMPFSGDYMTDLRKFDPTLFERHRSLVVRRVNPSPNTEYVEQRQDLTRWIAAEYELLDNYGFITVLIDAEGRSGEAWRLASDLILFAERFREAKIPQMFFRWREVAVETQAHISGLNADQTRFDLANEGFTYRDTFVMHSAGKVRRLVVLMQKNKRDETPIPCPACRTDDVQGNSYPQLGVKSWECRNPVCPDRSIYNRGKRFDFRGLLRQEAIEHDDNEIPVRSVRRWQRDVVEFVGDDDIVDMLVRHYSMRGDTVSIVGINAKCVPSVGRTFTDTLPASVSVLEDEFWSSCFFERYVRPALRQAPRQFQLMGEPAPVSDARWTVMPGRAEHVLEQWPDNSFDRAVSSPPYFNAREYSQWPNLYCYLHDMTLVAAQVHRVLKPGALFAYNIFDYFDNERIICFSDMGRKRIPLSALMANIFQRVGFDFIGGVVWDKGEIHGKRGFNAGNNTPFYQAPFNCWEHVLVLQKRGSSSSKSRFGRLPCVNQVLRIHPVVKMVRGENRYGHTAPFPVELPAALLDGLPRSSLVLDPFGGSGTTARAALDLGHHAVIIEAQAEYCDLSRRLIAEHEAASRAETPRRSRQGLYSTGPRVPASGPSPTPP